MAYRKIEDGREADMGATVAAVVKLSVAGLGIMLTLLGAIYALSLFGTLHEIMSDAGDMKQSIDSWAEAIGGEEFSFTIQEKSVPFARVMALVVLGGLGFLLAYISMGLVVTGARVLSWILRDRPLPRARADADEEDCGRPEDRSEGDSREAPGPRLDVEA